MAKLIHTILLDDNTSDKRETAGRRYTHAVVSTVTQAEKDRRIALACKDLAEKARALTAAMAQATPEDAARHAALLVEDARLEERIVAPDGRTMARWLAEGDAGYAARRACTDARFSTVVAKIEGAAAVRDHALRHLKACEAMVIGACRVEGWSQNARNAEAAARTAAKHQPLNHIAVRTDIAVRQVQPRTRKAVESTEPTQLQAQVLAALGDETKTSFEIKGFTHRGLWMSLVKLTKLGLVEQVDVKRENMTHLGFRRVR